jgi:phosphatidylglycerophosphate synthase
METRENNGVLAGAERRLLVWLAERMPRRVNSDHLTALALVGMAICAAGFVGGGWGGRATPGGWAVLAIVAGLFVNWFGDSLDGTLARVRNCQRPRYGYYLDHVLDAVGALMLFGSLALSGFMTPVVALLLLAAYYLVAIEVYLATHALGRFRMAFWKIGPTELRVILIAGACALMRDPWVTLAGSKLLLFDVGGIIGAIGLATTAAVSAVQNARTLYREEPLSRSHGTRGEGRTGDEGREVSPPRKRRNTETQRRGDAQTVNREERKERQGPTPANGVGLRVT